MKHRHSSVRTQRSLSWLALVTLLATSAFAAPPDSNPSLEGVPETNLQHRLDLALDLEQNVSQEPIRVLAQPPENDLIKRLQPMKEVRVEQRSWVEQAPKTWPFPMVVSPGRPVLPGSVW